MGSDGEVLREFDGGFADGESEAAGSGAADYDGADRL